MLMGISQTHHSKYSFTQPSLRNQLFIMEIINLTFLAPLALLLLRIIVGIIFFSSGRSHAQNPEERGKSIGMSPAVTQFLGIAEMAAGVTLALGIFTQLAALVIIFVMLGAIYKKIFEWNTGFYADKGFGWHYDLLLLLAAFVILATRGGAYVII